MRQANPRRYTTGADLWVVVYEQLPDVSGGDHVGPVHLQNNVPDLHPGRFGWRERGMAQQYADMRQGQAHVWRRQGTARARQPGARRPRSWSMSLHLLVGPAAARVLGTLRSAQPAARWWQQEARQTGQARGSGEGLPGPPGSMTVIMGTGGNPATPQVHRKHPAQCGARCSRCSGEAPPEARRTTLARTPPAREVDTLRG